jgi:hypothetical protein
MNDFGRSSDLFHFIFPSHSGMEQWFVAIKLSWNLQQRVLFLILTGFPLDYIRRITGVIPKARQKY